MASDRELLEAAAKAAGIYDDWPRPDYEVTWNGDGLWCSGMGQGELWTPLTDDGDALRLAVKLQKMPAFEEWSDGWHAVIWVDREVIAEPLGVDPCAATRRAITRAAAAIFDAQASSVRRRP